MANKWQLSSLDTVFSVRSSFNRSRRLEYGSSNATWNNDKPCQNFVFKFRLSFEY